MSSVYKLQFHRKAKDSLAKLVNSDRPLALQIKSALNQIQEDPYIGIPLTGAWKGYYKYRVRDYRIVYELKNEQIIVYVLRISHRRDVYKEI